MKGMIAVVRVANEVKAALTIEALVDDDIRNKIGTKEPDRASGGGTALGLSASAGGDLGTGKLIPSP